MRLPIVWCVNCNEIAVDRWQGKDLCRACLCPEVEPEVVVWANSSLADAEMWCTESLTASEYRESKSVGMDFSAWKQKK